MDEELRLTGRTGVMHARSEVCEEDIGLSYGHARICGIRFGAPECQRRDPCINTRIVREVDGIVTNRY